MHASRPRAKHLAAGTRFSRGLIALVIALTCAPAAVIPVRGAPPKTTRPAIETVVVTAAQSAQTTSIDRKTYSISGDLQGVSGSADDVLRNLPAVDVDVLGNVSVRGDPNVQILIDGKPSTMMSPANRGAALQQMPANSIDSIEVMTNPSAQYKPDGSSGIINIITKKNYNPGLSGTAVASFGSEGRYNLGGSAAYNTGRLTLSGSISLRHETRKRITTDRRIKHALAGGGDTASSQDIIALQARTTQIASAGFTYDIDPKSRFGGNFSYNRRAESPSIFEHNTATAVPGAIFSDYDRLGSGRGIEINTQAAASYRRSFDDQGVFTFDLRRGETREDQHRFYANTFLTPPGPGTSDEQILRGDEITSELTAEYARPLSGTAKLNMGYDLQWDSDDYNNYGGAIIAGARIPDPNQTNHFVFGQTIHALYATYERALGDWTVLAGLRLEETLVDTNQITSGLKSTRNYFRVYPTLHLEHDLGDDWTLRLSYSHRVARPEPEDLNPYAIYADAFNARAGNPLLKPQETHSLEASYEFHAFGADLSATAFLRRSYNGMTDVSRYISPAVLLTTKENLGKSTSAGAEFSVNGKLGADLAYKLSGSLFYNQIDAGNLGFSSPRSAFGYSGKASFDYALGVNDLVQLSASVTGKRLTAQGYREPSGVVNLGYRHDILDGLAFVATVADLFGTQHDGNVIAIPTLTDRYNRRQLARTTFVGLSWNFGGGRKGSNDAGFDYSSAP